MVLPRLAVGEKLTEGLLVLSSGTKRKPRARVKPVDVASHGLAT